MTEPIVEKQYLIGAEQVRVIHALEYCNPTVDDILDECKKNPYPPDALQKEIKTLKSTLDFYKQRCDLLQQQQSGMRDPERTIVCDILANGVLLPDPKGSRYGHAHADEQLKAEVMENVFKILNGQYSKLKSEYNDHKFEATALYVEGRCDGVGLAINTLHKEVQP
jgi:hypothetical protein